MAKLQDEDFCKSLKAKNIKAGFAGTYVFAEWALILKVRGRNRVSEVLQLSEEDRKLLIAELIAEAKRYKHNRWQSNHRLKK